jgi:hypothetical protein
MARRTSISVSLMDGRVNVSPITPRGRHAVESPMIQQYNLFSREIVQNGSLSRTAYDQQKRGHARSRELFDTYSESNLAQHQTNAGRFQDRQHHMKRARNETTTAALVTEGYNRELGIT